MFLDPPGNFPLYGDYKKMMAERVDGRRQYRTIGQILVSCPPGGVFDFRPYFSQDP